MSIPSRRVIWQIECILSLLEEGWQLAIMATKNCIRYHGCEEAIGSSATKLPYASSQGNGHEVRPGDNLI